ncbi:MAG: hypothetical protein EHM40_01925 [Chloroflexi bacterium]|nr:MAG: hypothetical protein EHM40_01925 [Chloroflexota bacterium]
MANIYRNIFIHGLTDILGDRSVYCKTRSGKTILAGKALFDDNWKYMEIQKSHPEAIREAITYADFAKTQEAYLNRELVTGVSAYYTAIIDWFSTPKVLEINVDAWTGRPGQRIRVKARDNVGVAGVSLVIRDQKGNVLETGEAVQAGAGSPWWIYTTRDCANLEPFPCVEAIAWDLPGNCDSFTIS